MTADRYSRVLAAVDAVDVVGIAQRMVQTRSYTGTSGEGDLARLLAQELSQTFDKVRLQPVDDERSNVILTIPGTGGGPGLMLNGHLDTNPEMLGWSRGPFAGEIDDGYIYGVGISNMKAADAAFIGAVTALRDADVSLRGDLTLCLVVGEQQGGLGTVALLADGVSADHFIVGEPTGLSVLTLHAGSFPVRVSTVGVSRHISKRDESVNAVTAMTEVITALQSIHFRGPATPQYQSLRRCSVASIRGGVGPEFHDWRPGLVPDHCTITVDIRYSPGQTEESVLADLRQLLQKVKSRNNGLKVHIERVQGRQRMPAFESSVDSRVATAVIEAHKRVRGVAPEVGAVTPYKYYGTDAAHLAAAGMSGVVCGPGGQYNTMPDERVSVDELVDAAKLYALAIMDVCG